MGAKLDLSSEGKSLHFLLRASVSPHPGVRRQDYMLSKQCKALDPKSKTINL